VKEKHAQAAKQAEAETKLFKRERDLSDALLDLFDNVPEHELFLTTNVPSTRFEEICAIVKGLREEREANGTDGS